MEVERHMDSNPKFGGTNSDEQRERVVPAGLDSILDDDDDFELTFSLDVQQRAAAESLARSRQVLRSEEYRQLFHLPPEEVLIQDFNCALQKKILLQGHMYLFEHYVCFYSNIFGYEKKKVIVLKDVTSVRKARTAGLFPNAIEITAWGKKSFFASFLSRDEAYRLIMEGWSRHSKNAIMDSDTQSNASAQTTRHMQGAQDQHDACVSESSFESRDNFEAPGEHINEADIAAENDTQINDADISEAGPPLVDSSSSSEMVDTNASDDSPSKAGNFWEVEDESAPKVPQQYRAVLECELPVDVKDFFKLFFSDDSAKFCESFHKQCGDEDFQCTNWAKDQHFGHVRDVSFRHPVKVYFGPKASNCQEVQRYRVYQNNHLIVETSQQMNDIPYGDHFRVEGRWDVVPMSNKKSPHCGVRIFVDVSFSKKTVWKGKIEQGTYDECQDVYATWLAEAHKLLQEKGLLNTKQTKEEKPKPSKRKPKAEPGQSHGPNKPLKNASSVSNQATKAGQSKKSAQVPSSGLASFSQHISHYFSHANLTSISRAKVTIVICMISVCVLMQTGIITNLSRSSKIQYSSMHYPRWGDFHDSLKGYCGRQDVLLLEQFIQLLWDEIDVAEARLKALEHNLNLLRVNLNLAEKFSSKAAPSTGTGGPVATERTVEGVS